MNIFQSTILGIVQGITEFLPISSTAHLRIVPALCNWEDPGTAFSAVIQLGTMFSVVVYFWKDLRKIFGSFFYEVISKRKLSDHDSKLAFWIFLGTVPIGVFGLLFKEPIEKGMVRDLNIISFYLVFFGLLLMLSEMIAKQNRKLSAINILDVMLFGLAQAFALIPGVSRSGVTLFAGLLLGFGRADAARFSFLLSVPAVFASGMLELYSLALSFETLTTLDSWLSLVVGVIFAFLSGYLAIDFLLKYLQKNRTSVFVIYRVMLGLIIFYLSFKNIIQ